MLLFSVYLVLTRLIGLLNLRYDYDRHRFDRNHRPTIIYCLILNVAYIGLMPLATYYIIDFLSEIETANLQLYINNAIGVTEVITFYVTIYGAWLRRGHLQSIANTYVRYFRQYQKYIYAAKRINRSNLLAARQLLAVKMLTALCKVIVACTYIFGDSVEDFDESIALTPGYVISTVFVTIVSTFVILVDCNIFFGLYISDLLLATLQQQLRGIYSEIKLMQRCKQRNSGARQRRTLWLQLLAKEVLRLAKHEVELKSSIANWLNIYQVQLLMHMLCSLLTLIVLFFSILLLIADMEAFRWGPFTFYLLIVLASFGNLILTFYVCERIRLRFSNMRVVVYKIWMHAGWIEAIGTIGGDQLVVLLEQFSLELQQQPCNLNICGFFDLSMNTGMQMTEAIVLNILLLLQLAHKGM